MEKVQSANKSWLLRHWNFDSIHVTKFSGWNRTAWENVTMSGRCLVPKQRRTDPHQKTHHKPVIRSDSNLDRALPRAFGVLVKGGLRWP